MIDVKQHLTLLAEAFNALNFDGCSINERMWCETTGRYAANVKGLWLGIELTLDGKLAKKPVGKTTKPITRLWSDKDKDRAKTWIEGDT
jgi:hypothetical protein